MRLFYGLSLPDDVRRCTASHAQQLAAQFPGRYVSEQNYHITLAFLGDVPAERMDDAQDVLRRCILNVPPPVLTLGETGFFSSREKAIVVIHVKDFPSLYPLHQSLVQALDDAGLPADHGPFSPHITLARRVSLPDSALPACKPLAFSPTHTHLYLSARNDQNILSYTPLHSFPFRV